MSSGNRKRGIPIYVRVSEEEHDQIQPRMAEVDTINMSAYMRKMALNGHILHVDLSPVRELLKQLAAVVEI